MGHFRTELTFEPGPPDEVRIYHNGDYIGDIYKHEDILNPGAHYYLIWLSEDFRGWKRVRERRNLRAATEHWVDTHPLY